MKRNLLLLALLAGSVTAVNAQKMEASLSNVAKVSTTLLHETRMTAPLQKEMKGSLKRTFEGNRRVVNRAEADENVSLFYGMPAGALYYDVMDNSSSLVNMTMITGAFQDATFYNYSRDINGRLSDVQWSWPSGSPLKGTESVDANGNMTAQNFGAIQCPILTYGGNTYGDEFTNTKGESISARWLGGLSSFGTVLVNTGTATEDMRISLSNACVSSEGFYGGFGQGGGEFTSNLSFITLSGGKWVDTGKKTVGFAEYFEKPLGLVYAEDVTAFFWTEGINTASPLSGKTLKATIYTFDSEGNFVPYAEAEATDEDATMLGTNGLCYISFKFTEDDPLFGKVEAPIVLPNEDFIVTLTGFDTIDGYFTATFAGAASVSGYGYAILEDGSISTIPYSNSESPQVNLHIGFHAAVPVAELASPQSGEGFVPAEGGYVVTGTSEDGKNYNDFNIYTLNESEDWIVDSPEWVDEIEFDDTNINKGLLTLFVKCQPLPVGVEGRTGKIVLTLYGKSVELTLLQGNTGNGIVTVEKDNASENAPVYNLSGVRVSKDTKGLLIKNGKKFFNK